VSTFLQLPLHVVSLDETSVRLDLWTACPRVVGHWSQGPILLCRQKAGAQKFNAAVAHVPGPFGIGSANSN
jgi:hypothetical protein